MAEVYRPESDDHLSPYPRAPPPSPEAQHRALGGIFEFPRDMLEGFGIDLRRRDFDFTDIDEDNDDASPLHKQVTVRRSSPKRAASSDTDDSDCEQPGSPMKRMCSAPSTMPNSFEAQAFTPSFMSSTSNSCTNGSLLQPVSTGDIKVSIPNFSELAACNSHSPEHRPKSHSHSTSPILFQQQHSHGAMTSPYSIPPRSNGSVTPTHQPTTQPHDSSHLLSKSFDLHNVHSHFPAHFEVTPPVPEVRPGRSHTLGATTYAQESPNFRTRKVSLKRNYGELESDPTLQFSFDYSYSSTGSSGDSDWIVIESDLTSYPQGKKACCQQEPLSSVAAAAMSTKRHSNSRTANSSPLHSSNPVTTSFRNGNGFNTENLFTSQEVASTTHSLVGQSSTSPLGVLTSNNGADLSVFPGGSAASNGSESHSPLHTHLGMIHGSMGNGSSSSAEVHSASSAAASYAHTSTAEAALAERSQRAELIPQWSMEMMDCGEYSNRLDSIDSMDCGQTSDPSVTMQSLGAVVGGDGSEQFANFENSTLFSNHHGQPLNSQTNRLSLHSQGLIDVGNVPNSHQPLGHTHPMVGMATKSQTPFKVGGGESLTSGRQATTSTATTRHSFIESYFISYHNGPSTMAGGGVVGGGAPGETNTNDDTRSSVSKSL